MLVVEGLDVYYGRAHALQGVSLTLERGVLGIVGRNGMGKTTLCNAITGLVPARGSVRLAGEEILGLAPQRDHAARHRLRAAGPARVALAVGRRDAAPGGRPRGARSTASTPCSRAWPSAAATAARSSRAASSRCWRSAARCCWSPKLLVMDEPTEGLAPVIVEQVAQALRELAAEGEIAVLLIEQNLGVAISVADRIGVMVNGRIAQEMPAAATRRPTANCRSGCSACARTATRRKPGPAPQAGGAEQPGADAGLHRAPRPWRRRAFARRPGAEHGARLHALERRRHRRRRWPTSRGAAPHRRAATLAPRAAAAASPQVFDFPVAASSVRAAYVAGTFDTKARELFFLRQCLERSGLRVVTVDLATSGKPSPASVHPREVARHHPQGESAVFSGDRGSATAAMALAFEAFVRRGATSAA